MNDLLPKGWQFKEESIDSVEARYNGFGISLFKYINQVIPGVFQNLKFYQSQKHQIGDVYAIYENVEREFAIQLDPDSEVICLWDNDAHIEIGYWEEDENKASVEFIKKNFLDKKA